MTKIDLIRFFALISVFPCAVFFASESRARAKIDASFETTKRASSSEPSSAQTNYFDFNASTGFGASLGEGELSTYRLTGRALRTNVDPLPGLNRSLEVTSGSVGLSYMRLMQGREIMSVQLSGRVTSDGRAEPVTQPVASLFATTSLGERVTGLYGGAYAYTFGEGAIFPLLGGLWQSSESTRLLFVLPVLLNFTVDVGAESEISLYLKPKGLKSVMVNDQSFAGASSSLRVRTSEVELGAKFSTQISKGVSGWVQAGFKGRRRVEILDGDRSLYTRDLDSTPSIGVGLTMGFAPDRSYQSLQMTDELH